MIAFLLAEGFEETEAIVPIDILKRAGFDVKTVSISESLFVSGSHGIAVKCDKLSEELDFSELEAVVLPGGMPGTLNLDKSQFTDKILSFAVSNNLVVGAICAAPSVLGKRGYLKGKKAVCFTGYEKELMGAEVLNRPAVRDGKFVTAWGAGGAFEFGFELINALKNENGAFKNTAAAMRYKTGDDFYAGK